MSLQNLTTYTEQDTNNRFSETSTRATFTNSPCNETNYLYYDFGVDYFAGDFTFLFDFIVSSGGNGSNTIIGLGNDLSDYRTNQVASKSQLCIRLGYNGGSFTIELIELDSGSETSDNYAGTINTNYYLTFTRDESVGTYGTIYCYVYSDSARTTLLDTLTLTLNTSKKDFRYFFALQSYNNGTAVAQTGYMEYLVDRVDVDYTKGDYNVLPTDDTDLETAYGAQGYFNVSLDDNVYETQSASNEYWIKEFKNKHSNNTTPIDVTWKGKSDLAPSSSTVYLQIYNRDSTTWETLDSDNATVANTEFTLTGSQNINLSYYYDANYWVSFRVYQEAAT